MFKRFNVIAFLSLLMVLMLMNVAFVADVSAGTASKTPMPPGVPKMEDIFNNKWNVLVLIYKDVDTPNFKKSFTDDEISTMKEQLKSFPDVMSGLSENRMEIPILDIYETNETIRSVRGGFGGDLTFGSGDTDINFDRYLVGKDYQQVIVIAPLEGHPNQNGNWGGLGGGAPYIYDGKIVYYSIINFYFPREGRIVTIRGKQYDTHLGIFVHEMLHNVELNSGLLKCDDFATVHGAEDNGYVAQNYDWFDFYSDLMCDRIKGKRGFNKKSFIVNHVFKISTFRR